MRYLHYADAEKIAPKLKEQITGIAQAAAGRAGGAGAAGGGSAQPQAEKNAMIWADPTNNALVITAPPKIMRAIMDIIDKLDIRRPQVLVEAIIVEVDVDKNAELGVNWAAFSNGARAFPSASFVSPVGGTSIVDLAGAVAESRQRRHHAAAGHDHRHRPHRRHRREFRGHAARHPRRHQHQRHRHALGGDHGQPGSRAEGGAGGAVRHRPVHQHAAVTGGTVNPFQTIQREEVGTILKVTPQITPEGKAVMLKISIESSSIGQKPAGAVDLITNKRTITTNVLIEDGGIVVLGGLIEDNSVKGENRVPYLGSIPIIGQLFKTRNATSTKNNLMIFIRPKILRDQAPGGLRDGSPSTTTCATSSAACDQTEVLPLLPGVTRGTLTAIPQAATGAHRRATAPPAPSAPGPTVPPTPAAPHCGAARATGPQCHGQPGLGRTASELHRRAPGEAVNELATPRLHPADADASGRRLSFAFAKRHGVLVNRVVNGVAECTYRESASPLALAEVRRYLRRSLQLERVPEAEFDALLRRAYEAGSDAMQAVEGLDDTTDLAHLAQDLPEQADLLESDDDAPIIRLINAVLTQAVKENASDIHVEPFENRLVVRFRVDGVLREVLQSKRAVAPLVVSRIKVMSQPRHRREAPAAGRPHQPDASPGARSTCASPPSPPVTASGWCCVSWTSRPAGWT